MNTEFPDKPSSFIIPAARELEPCLHGSLDGLCGLYAIINAIRIAAFGYRLDTHHTNHALFTAGIAKLEEFGSIADCVGDGMNKTEFRALTKHLCRKASNLKIKLRYHALPVRVPDSERQHNISATLTSGLPVLINLEHKFHYSVVTGFTPCTLTLFDSFGYTRTNIRPDRYSCAIMIMGRSTSSRE
tara:strand:- start:1471 stop:2031 length:561 start_codon:yes stop_codon:yes gene_type:complete